MFEARSIAEDNSNDDDETVPRRWYPRSGIHSASKASDAASMTWNAGPEFGDESVQGTFFVSVDAS